jgi:ArsR family transcriptional regulator
MDELDILLSVIENPTRRRILEALVREPHYPLQLSKELGLSQQGIMKHLKVLEGYHMVRSYDEESDQGGPNRKIYVPITGFNIVVDLGPGLFSAQIVTRDLEGRSSTSERLSEEDQMMFLERVEDVRDRIGEIDEELQELGRRRAELIRAKELALNEACGIVESTIEDYQTRRIMFEFIQRPELTPNQIAKELGLRDDAVTRTIGFYLKGAD